MIFKIYSNSFFNIRTFMNIHILNMLIFPKFDILQIKKIKNAEKVRDYTVFTQNNFQFFCRLEC